MMSFGFKSFGMLFVFWYDVMFFVLIGLKFII